MKSPEKVIYIQGVGSEPAVQNQLPAMWSVYGLLVVPCFVNWTERDYPDYLEMTGDYISECAIAGERVSVVGASGGGKTALSLLTRHADNIHRVVTISGKVAPYQLRDRTRATYPNLVTSSEILADDICRISSEMLAKILCTRPLRDEVVSPDEAVISGANQHVLPVEGHIEGITYALTTASPIIANFIQQD